VLALAVIGWRQVLYYYVHVGAEVARLYRSASYNYSMAAVGWRVFAGTNDSALGDSLTIRPLVPCPAIAGIAAAALPVFVLAAGLYLAYKMRVQSLAFGVMVCVSVLVCPVSWIHYLVLMFLPLGLVLTEKERWRLRASHYYLLGCTLLLFYVHNGALDALALVVAGASAAISGGETLPSRALLVTLIPVMVPLLSMVLLAAVDRAAVSRSLYVRADDDGV